MSALTRWRSKVRHLTKAEKDKDLRRSCNIDAFNEFKEKRANQQRKRRALKACQADKPRSRSRQKTHRRHRSSHKIHKIIKASESRRNREKRMHIMREKGRKPFKIQKIQKRKKVNKITVSKLTPVTKCVQFIHLSKSEPRGSQEFVFYVNARFFDKIGVKISQGLYTESDGSAHKLILDMINSTTKDMFKPPSSRSVESYINKGKNQNERMDYAFFLLFEYLSDKSYVTGLVKDMFQPKYPRKIVATVISQGGTVF